MTTLEIAGMHIGEVITMNVRLTEMLNSGICEGSINSLQEQRRFLCKCLEVENQSLVRISSDELKQIYGMLKTLDSEIQEMDELLNALDDQIQTTRGLVDAKVALSPLLK